MTTTNQQRNVFITGANRGLGLALARVYLACGARVFGSYRSTSHLEDLRSLEREWSASFTPIKLDLSQPERFAETATLMHSLITGLDVLINNAGIHSQSRDVQRHQRNLELGSLEASGLQMMLQTNALSPLLLTQALLPLLEASDNATILNVSSRRGSLTNKHEGGNYGYCVSKVALNMMTRALAGDLRTREIKVISAHPGVVQTAMSGHDAPLSPLESAHALMALVDQLDMTQSGQFYNWDGSVHPW